MHDKLTAGELSKKALSDTTKYDALEVGYAIVDDTMEQLRICIDNHKNIIDEDEFCLVLIIADDPLIKNLKRRKYYAWPYLPKPRPNQTVFLYNKPLDQVTKRLWTLPNAMVMSELHSLSFVEMRYQKMKEWSDAFYKGWRCVKNKKGNVSFYNADPFYFWGFVRKDQNTDMLSEHEYFLKHREELIQAGCKATDSLPAEPFDFSKIAVKKVVDTQKSLRQ